MSVGQSRCSIQHEYSRNILTIEHVVLCGANDFKNIPNYSRIDAVHSSITQLEQQQRYDSTVRAHKGHQKKEIRMIRTHTNTRASHTERNQFTHTLTHAYIETTDTIYILNKKRSLVLYIASK